MSDPVGDGAPDEWDQPEQAGSAPSGSTPLDILGVIGSQDVMVTPTLRHAEFFTMRGLLTVL